MSHMLIDVSIRQSRFKYNKCRPRSLRRLLCASYALSFKAVFEATVAVLSKLYPSDASTIARSARIPLDEAIETVECVVRCGMRVPNGIYKRAIYEIATASEASLNAHRNRLTEVLHIGGANITSMERENGLLALRNYRRSQLKDFQRAPCSEYPSVCDHTPSAPLVTEYEREDKKRRWFGAMREIRHDSEGGTDLLRALYKTRSNLHVRPRGWKECPGNQCTIRIHAAWDRRIEREWLELQKMIEEHVTFPSVLEGDFEPMNE